MSLGHFLFKSPIYRYKLLGFQTIVREAVGTFFSQNRLFVSFAARNLRVSLISVKNRRLKMSSDGNATILDGLRKRVKEQVRLFAF